MTPSSSHLALESTVPGARSTYRFQTADGVCSSDSFRLAERLLLDHLWDVDVGRLLVLEANYGVVGTVLADRAPAVHMVESSARAARLCERNAAENGIDATTSLTADATTLDERFDTVAYAPKPYTPIEMGMQRIADGIATLDPGGQFYLAAATRTGLQRYARYLRDRTSHVDRIATHDGYAVLEASIPTTVDHDTVVTPRTITPTVDGVDLTICTLPGIFSPTGLDDGTRLLLETASVDDGDRVLDLCCGAGPVGVWAGLAADCEVWLTDDDRVATRCAERSLDASGVTGTVVTADCTRGVRGRTFDTVLTNPPTHAGDGVLRALFDGAHDVLAPNGTLHLVHHRGVDLDHHLARFDAVEPRRPSDEYGVVRATR